MRSNRRVANQSKVWFQIQNLNSRVKIAAQNVDNITLSSIFTKVFL